MKLQFCKQYFFIILLFFIFSNNQANSSNNHQSYSKENISNYFSALLAVKNDNITESLKYFEKVKELKKIHFPFIQEFTLALVREKKIKEVVHFLRNLNKESTNFFEANILLGSTFLINDQYNLAVDKFNLANENFEYSNFEKLIAKTLINYTNVFENYKNADKDLFKDFPKNFTLIHKALLNCYLDNENVDYSFLKLINSENINYTRYIYFYINYLLKKKRVNEAQIIIEKHTDVLANHLLLDQTKYWINNGKVKQVTKIFDCQKPKHLVSEFFYLIANLYSSEELYNKSNFYLNLSLYFNPKFETNTALLAENFLQMKKYNKSKKIYENFDNKNFVFYWYAVKRITLINKKISNEKIAINFLENNFNQIEKPNIKIYFDMANFYKTFEKFEDSIKYYTQVINDLNEKHPKYSEVLYQRGGSYERLKMWSNSDSDLLRSIEINSENPHVLNYLAYSWLERGHKIEEAMNMLVSAHNKKPNDPYITDSIAWAYFLVADYIKAEELIIQALKFLPSDPIINDHYGDILWKLNKNLQANYIWSYVLNMEETTLEIKEKIKTKLIFGLDKPS